MNFDNSYASLPSGFFQKIQPTPVEQPSLILWNEKLANELNLSDELIRDRELLANVFAGNQLISGTDPIALAYAGHQFGNFVPQLGDGRAHLLGELIDSDNRRWDIQLKGSGQTRFSRRGDGRSAIGPAVREYIMSEAMYALGIPTTRSLAVVATGEDVYREQIQPGAEVTRVASSHIRVGTFQYFAARNDTDSLFILIDYTISRHYPELIGQGDKDTPRMPYL